jgi:transposase
MFYVGIDQHKRHLSICTRNKQGDVVQRRQVKTTWGEVDRFLAELQERAQTEDGYVAIIEVCGFNGWLIQRLERHGCRRVFLVAAPPQARQKTDRRDAARLSELLWINRGRIDAGHRLIHVREVYQPTRQEQAVRQLTQLRHRQGQRLTRIKNAIRAILRRHNLEQECPTKGMFTQAAVRWLKTLSLPFVDRMELDMHLADYVRCVSQIDQANALIAKAAQRVPAVALLRTLPKIGDYTALSLWAFIGPIGRFAHARSLANFFGITPGCRNSGDSDRPGRITKAGHPFIRFLLGQMVLHALRGDPGLRSWYRQVKRRRGAKVARVAVMRRLCVALWHMLSRGEPYRPVGSGRDKTTTKTRCAA